uniref:Family with sequence similarity 170 member A n=1 Tax=Oryctolagus cuniculus TaxID=9986 RepID=G1U910_RABIT
MKRKQKVKHLESTCSPQTEKPSRGISTLHKCTPKYLEEKILAHEAKETSSESEYTCQSSLQKHSCAESQKSQVYAPETSIARPACSQAAGERSSVSEYFSCVSSPNKNPAAAEDGIQKHQQEYCVQSSEMPLQILTPYQRNCFHYHLANEPCTPEIHRRKERDMKVYYMRVQSKKETAGLRNAQKGLVPLQRKKEVQEMTFPGKIPIVTNLPTMSAWELLTDSECGCDVEEQEKVGVEEKQEEPDSPAGLLALQRRPRARTPEWLVTPESGYKCMGCCRVFPSRTVLQRHVQHGVEEGFSCRAFHLALAWLKSKMNMK